MNFAGLGLSFSAQDKGLGKAVKTATTGLGNISSSVAEITTRTARMGLGAALKMPNIGGAAREIQRLGNDTRVTTTYFENFAVQSNRTSAQLLAGLNLTDKQFSKTQGKIKNVAFAMNIDAGTVGKSMTSLIQSGVDATEAGFKNFQEFQKVMTVTGTDSVQFASALGVMKNQLKMSPKLMSDVVKSTAAIGRQFNMGREAMASLSDQVQVLNENAQLLPKSFGPMEQAQFLKGTTMVSGAMRSLGFSSDQAVAASKRLTGVLLQSRAGFERLYAGLGGLPEASKALAEHFPAGVEDAFQLLQKSPDQFVTSMGKVVDSVRKNIKDMSPDQQQKVMRRFQAQMQDTFGPEVLALMNRGFGKIGPAMEKARDPMLDAADALKELAKHHKDGRTAAERFMLAEDRLFTKLKGMKGVMKDSEFIASYRKQTDLLAGKMKEISKKGGVVGKATDMMVEFANFGIGGVLGKMIGPPDIGLAIGSMAKKFGPVVDALPGLAVGFQALASPITLVAAALAGLYFGFKEWDKEGHGLIGNMVDKIKENGPKVAKAALGVAKDAFGAIKGVLNDLFTRVDWGKVSASLHEFAAKAVALLGQAVDAVWDTAKSIFFAFLDVDWAALGNALVPAVVGFYDMVLDTYEKMAREFPEIVARTFRAAFDFVKNFDWGALESGVFKIVNRMADMFIVGLRYAGKKIKWLLSLLKDVDWSGVGKEIGRHATRILVKIGEITAKVGVVIYDGLVYAIERLPQFMIDLANSVADFLVGIVDGAVQYLVGKFPSLEEPIRIVGAVIQTTFEVIRTALVVGFQTIEVAAKAVWAVIKFGAKVAWEALDILIISPLKYIAKLFKGIYDAVAWVVKKVAKALSRASDKISDFLISPVEVVKDAWRSVTGFFSDLFDGVVDTAKDIWDSVTGIFSDGADDIELSIKRNTGDIQKLSENAQKASEDAAKQAVADGLKTGDLVRTSTGKVIKASDAVVQYVKNSSGEIKKIVHEANEMQFAKLDFALYKEAREGLDKYREAIKAAGGDANKMAQANNDFMKTSAEFRKTHGVDMRQMVGTGEALRQQFAVKKSDLQSIGDQYGTAASDAYKEVAGRSADHFAGLMKDLYARAGDLSPEAFAKEEARLKGLMAAAAGTGEMMQKAVTGQISEVVKSYTDAGGEVSGAADLISTALTTKLAKRSAEVLAKIPKSAKEARDKTEKLFSGMGDTMALEIEQAITGVGDYAGLSAEQTEKAVRDIVTKHEKMISEVEEKASSKMGDLLATAQAGFLKFVGVQEGALAKVTEGVKASSGKATAEIESFGLTSKEAAQSVQEIGMLNTKKLKANITLIETKYIKFLRTLRTKGVPDVRALHDSFNKLFSLLTKEWDAQTVSIENFFSDARSAMDRLWSDIAKDVGESLFLLKTKMFLAISSLKGDLMGLNLMDLLASPADIVRWAESVVLALSKAFLGGRVWDAAIGSAYDRSLSLITDLENRGSMSVPGGGSAGADMQRQESSLAAERIRSAIDEPRWATEGYIPKSLKEQNELLKKMIVMMGMSSGIYKSVAEGEQDLSELTGAAG